MGGIGVGVGDEVGVGVHRLGGGSGFGDRRWGWSCGQRKQGTLFPPLSTDLSISRVVLWPPNVVPLELEVKPREEVYVDPGGGEG